MQRLRNHQDVTEQDGGIQVVPAQGLQRHLRNVSRVGQQLQEVLALGLLVRLVLWQVPPSLTKQPKGSRGERRRRRHCHAVARLVSTPGCHARVLASLKRVQPRWQVHCSRADATRRVSGVPSADAQGHIAAAVIQARLQRRHRVLERTHHTGVCSTCWPRAARSMRSLAGTALGPAAAATVLGVDPALLRLERRLHRACPAPQEGSVLVIAMAVPARMPYVVRHKKPLCVAASLRQVA